MFTGKGPRQHRGPEGMVKQQEGQKVDTVEVGVRPGQGRSGDSVLKTLYFFKWAPCQGKWTASHTPRAFAPLPLRLRQLSPEFSLRPLPNHH